jgi:hypothetical protein
VQPPARTEKPRYPTACQRQSHRWRCSTGTAAAWLEAGSPIRPTFEAGAVLRTRRSSRHTPGHSYGPCGIGKRDERPKRERPTWERPKWERPKCAAAAAHKPPHARNMFTPKAVRCMLHGVRRIAHRAFPMASVVLATADWVGIGMREEAMRACDTFSSDG